MTTRPRRKSPNVTIKMTDTNDGRVNFTFTFSPCIGKGKTTRSASIAMQIMKLASGKYDLTPKPREEQ